MAGEYLPPVVVEITGNTDGLVAAVAKAKAALDSLKGSASNIKINFDANTASLVKATAAVDAMTAATNRTTVAGRRWTGWLATAHMVLTAFGANIIADTVGLVAFGIGATTAIAPVIEAINNLGATYGYLTPVQQAATVRLTAFLDQFRNANQTGIFAVFNSLLDAVQGHVGKTGGIMSQATIAFENFAAMLRQTFSSGPWQGLFSRGSAVIQQDLTALFNLLNQLLNVIPALFHDFNGLGLFLINTAAGMLHLIAVIGNADPALMRFAAVVFLVYRALRMLGQFNQGSLLAKGFAATGLAAFSAQGALQNFRQFGLIPTIGFMTGLGTAGLVTAGVLGLVAAAAIYVGYANSKYVDTGQQVIATLTAQDDAVGYNIAGYQRLAAQLHQYYTVVTRGANALTMTSGQLMVMRTRLDGVSQAQQAASQTAQTLLGNLRYLEQTYGLTQQQAFQLAKATGVNLLQAFNKGGGAAQAARLKIAAYEQTVKASQNPTTVLGYDLGRAANTALQLDDRVTALTNAFNALLTPFANVIQDTVTWKDGNLQLEAAVDKAHGKVNDLGTSLQRLAASGLAQAINNTVKLSQDTLQQTGSMTKAIGPVRNEIAVLQALGSKSAVVSQAIRYLQQYINNLHSKSITITTSFITQGSPATGNSGIGVSGHRFASGTNYAPPGWALVGEQGPELMYMRGGEKVIPHNQSAAMIAGGGQTQVIEKQPIVVMLDSHPIYEAVKQTVYYKNTQNGMRSKNGSVQGRFGIR